MRSQVQLGNEGIRKEKGRKDKGEMMKESDM
jgi:hypothetical protein